MKLYGHPISATTRKVLTLLAEKKHDAELVVVDVLAKEQKQQAHLARQPFGHIPVLEHDGFFLYESNAILKYLDQSLPGPAFTPADVRDRARMEQWLSVEQTELYPAMKKIYARSAAKMWGQKDPGEAIGEEGRKEVSLVLDVLNQALSTSDHLAGPNLSLADICWLPDLNMLFDASLGEMVTGRPSLAAWWRRVSARPSWQSVLTKVSAGQKRA